MIKKTISTISFMTLLLLAHTASAQKEEGAQTEIPEDIEVEYVPNPPAFHSIPVMIHKSTIEFLGRDYLLSVLKEQGILTYAITLEGDKHPTKSKSVKLNKISKITTLNGIVLVGHKDNEVVFKMVGSDKKGKKVKTKAYFEF